jgi:hypothetical protein
LSSASIAGGSRGSSAQTVVDCSDSDCLIGFIGTTVAFSAAEELGS